MTFDFAPYSPYLSGLAAKHPDLLKVVNKKEADAAFAKILEPLAHAHRAASAAEVMKIIRVAKSRAALLTAIADINGFWTLEEVTGALSELAAQTLQATIDFLLTQAAAKGSIVPANPEKPSVGSGFIVLAMGKLGARELNYSSDIDLILLYDRENTTYRGEAIQTFFNKLSHEIVRFMQERTPDGYVFRTDLRLRPDPASTPPVIAINGAMTYYETVGQNWERAALIKARPIAGDIAAGHKFLKWIAPFIWRKHLDFAAIADIQSIKRQMDSIKGSGIKVAGHNIKTGEGGIREIEFYVQIHQLIWGGRLPQLRGLQTCDMLNALVAEHLIEQAEAGQLISHYRFFRMVEHRLQMVADQQTHTLPTTADELERIAKFCGFENVESFSAELLKRLHYVHGIFSNSFRGPGELGGTEGKLSFTGVDPDSDTLETLRGMGFENTTRVYELIAGWHRGARRATRTKRARELITEVTPSLLKALAATVNPDHAFIKFDEFLHQLPAGVQLFSLFTNHPDLLTLIATIMGSAPALADKLAKSPNLLDTVISGAFYRNLPTQYALLSELTAILALVEKTELEYSILRQFKNEKEFQIGVLLITRRITTMEAAHYLSGLSEIIITRLQRNVENEFAQTYGSFGRDKLSIIALGRLGAGELTFGSDLDLVFVYDDLDESVQSGGEKSFNPNVYFSRLVQRLLGTLTALSPQGRFYEVDTRLRPSGNQGPIAVSVSAFNQYFEKDAWTFEYMALSRARVITGNSELREKLSASIRAHICKPRDIAKLTADIRDMRCKVEQEFGTKNIWDIKHIRGGLMDLDFIAQYLVLANVNAHPKLYIHSTGEAISAATGLVLEKELGEKLTHAFDFMTRIFFLLRLCNDGKMDESHAPAGLKSLLSEALGTPDFDTLREQLAQTESVVHDAFNAIMS